MLNFNKKLVALSIGIVFCGLILIGCRKDGILNETIPEFKQENAIAVNEDLSVILTLADTFTEGYYRSDELLQMISEEASAFNREKGAGSMVAEKVDTKGDMVNAVIKFSDRESFSLYNDVEFFVGTIGDALNNGLRFDQLLYDIDDEDKTALREDLMAMEDAYVLITDIHEEKAPLTVETFGRIMYVSGGLERWYGRNSVRIQDFSDRLVYVVFKK